MVIASAYWPTPSLSTVGRLTRSTYWFKRLNPQCRCRGVKQRDACVKIQNPLSWTCISSQDFLLTSKWYTTPHTLESLLHYYNLCFPKSRTFLFLSWHKLSSDLEKVLLFYMFKWSRYYRAHELNREWCTMNSYHKMVLLIQENNLCCVWVMAEFRWWQWSFYHL